MTRNEARDKIAAAVGLEVSILVRADSWRHGDSGESALTKIDNLRNLS